MRENSKNAIEEEQIEWERLSYAIVGIAGGFTMILIFAGMFYYYCIINKGFDKVEIAALLRCGTNLADFATDLIFSVILFEESSDLAIPSLIEAVLPYVISCGVGLYWLERWRVRTDSRLLNYLKKYDTMLIILSVIVGFYSAVGLLRSKLFSHQMFNFQLRRNEVQTLANYRFINTVLLENIPALTIQI